MTTALYIDSDAIAAVAPALSMTTQQAQQWVADNSADLLAIRDFLRGMAVYCDAEMVENDAVDGRVLDATFVANALTYLTATGLIQRLAG